MPPSGDVAQGKRLPRAMTLYYIIPRWSSANAGFLYRHSKWNRQNTSGFEFQILMMDSNLPPEFDSLLAELEHVPEHARALWRYAMVLLLLDDKHASVLDSFEEDGNTMLLVQTTNGDEFWVVRPAMSEEAERELLAQVRKIADQDAAV